MNLWGQSLGFTNRIWMCLLSHSQLVLGAAGSARVTNSRRVCPLRCWLSIHKVIPFGVASSTKREDQFLRNGDHSQKIVHLPLSWPRCQCCPDPRHPDPRQHQHLKHSSMRTWASSFCIDAVLFDHRSNISMGISDNMTISECRPGSGWDLKSASWTSPMDPVLYAYSLLPCQLHHPDPAVCKWGSNQSAPATYHPNRITPFLALPPEPHFKQVHHGQPRLDVVICSGSVYILVADHHSSEQYLILSCWYAYHQQGRATRKRCGRLTRAKVWGLLPHESLPITV